MYIFRYSDANSPELRLHCNIARCNSQEPQSPTIERGDFTNTPDNLQHCDKENVQSIKDNNNISRQDSLFKNFISNYYAEETEEGKKDSVNDNVKTTDSLEYVENYYDGETSQETDDTSSDKVPLIETPSEKAKRSGVLRTNSDPSQGDINLRSHDQPRSHHWSGDWSLKKKSCDQTTEKVDNQSRTRHYSADALHDSRRVLLSESSSLMMGVTQLETVQVYQTIINIGTERSVQTV